MKKKRQGFLMTILKSGLEGKGRTVFCLIPTFFFLQNCHHYMWHKETNIYESNLFQNSKGGRCTSCPPLTCSICGMLKKFSLGKLFLFN